MKIGNLDISSIKVGSADCKVYLGDTLLYPTTPPSPEQQYLTFVAKADGMFKLSGNSVNFSLDNGSTWATLESNTDSPTVTAGNKIMWKGTLTPSTTGIGTFSASSQFDVEGNPMSLLFGDNFIGQTDLTGKNSAFRMLFSGNTNVVSAENMVLPATTLAMNCYVDMFYGCRSLTTAPELPATTLASSCYRDMFSSCTSLTTAPKLPATTLVGSCYTQMFYNCTNLNSITCLATDISATNCTTNWVNGVSSSGTFKKAASMSSWTTGNNGIPNGWTVVNA